MSITASNTAFLLKVLFLSKKVLYLITFHTKTKKIQTFTTAKQIVPKQIFLEYEEW